MLIEAAIVGIGIGIVVGALGAGGGILSVPVLVYLLGQNPHQAATLSLIIVGATACVSLVTRAPSGHVDWKNGSLFAFAGIAGTWGGSALNPLVSARTLMLEFCILLAFVAVFMVHKQLRARADELAFFDGDFAQLAVGGCSASASIALALSMAAAAPSRPTPALRMFCWAMAYCSFA